MEKKTLYIVGILAGLGIAYFAKAEDETPAIPNANGENGGLNPYDFITKDIKEAKSTRNNNPGNLKKPGTVHWQGTDSYDEQGHAIFHD